MLEAAWARDRSRRRACVEIAMRAMPPISLLAGAFGVVTLFFALFIFVGVLCIAYVAYFRLQVQREELCELCYFNAAWIARITLVLFAILWILGEIFRLPLLRKKGWPLESLSLKWRQKVCTLYVLLNLGLMEAGIFLRRTPLPKPISDEDKLAEQESGYCCVLSGPPVFLAQFFFVVTMPSFEFQKGYKKEKEGYGEKILECFTRAFLKDGNKALCMYPLLRAPLCLGRSFACS